MELPQSTTLDMFDCFKISHDLLVKTTFVKKLKSVLKADGQVDDCSKDEDVVVEVDNDEEVVVDLVATVVCTDDCKVAEVVESTNLVVVGRVDALTVVATVEDADVDGKVDVGKVFLNNVVGKVDVAKVVDKVGFATVVNLVTCCLTEF